MSHTSGSSLNQEAGSAHAHDVTSGDEEGEECDSMAEICVVEEEENEGVQSMSPKLLQSKFCCFLQPMNNCCCCLFVHLFFFGGGGWGGWAGVGWRGG